MVYGATSKYGIRILVEISEVRERLESLEERMTRVEATARR